MTWTPIANLTGPAVELQKSGDYLQWRVEDSGDLWTNLLPLSDIQGLPGTNAVPSDTAVGGYISTGGTSETKTALLAFVRDQQPMVNVADYGAVLDGATDDSAAWAAAYAAVADGGTIVIPHGIMTNTTATDWAISKSLTVVGPGGVKITNTAVRGFKVTASRVTFRDVAIDGPGATAYSATSNGIDASGIDSAHYLTGIRALNCRITNWGASAILAKYVTGLIVSEPDIDTIAYAGVTCASVTSGKVRGGSIRNIVQPSTSSNVVYGVSFSRTAGDATTDPRSMYCSVEGVELENVTWEALDTHGGIGCTFTGNIIRNCYRGIALVPSPIGATDTFAPLGCTVTGNTILSGVTDGSAGTGITFAGAGASAVVAEYGTGAISGNIVVGHGGGEGDTRGGITWQYTRGLTISGCTVIEASGAGAFVALISNVGFNCSGNTAIDPWSATYGGVAAYHIRNQDNTGYIGGNNHFAGSKTATNVNLFGIRFSATTGCDITVGVNNFAAAATKINGGTAVSKFSVLDKAPVVKAASPGTASSTDAAVINAVVTALQNVGIVT